MDEQAFKNELFMSIFDMYGDLPTVSLGDIAEKVKNAYNKLHDTNPELADMSDGPYSSPLNEAVEKVAWELKNDRDYFSQWTTGISNVLFSKFKDRLQISDEDKLEGKVEDVEVMKLCQDMAVEVVEEFIASALQYEEE